ncbi:uncharacterized protein LOC135843436 [Planococcus citri]|uniref:uncharacterized protein LOC135843436 n=1 Tax=Planococcus citri TaxID=170843 RepID=UPI0031F75892
MNSLIFSILCVFVTEVRSKQALLISIHPKYWGNLEDVWYNNTASDPYSDENEYFAACPASSSLEQQFNNDVSLTKQSVFSRLILWRNQSLTHNDVDFCEKSYEPAMIYNSHTKAYKIGYELYFFRNETTIQYSRDDYHYSYYNRVNTKKFPHEIENKTIFNGTSEFVNRYEEGLQIIFNFANGYPTLGFHWINVLSIIYTKNNKHAILETHPVKLENLKDECRNYRPVDEKLYSMKNQKKHLKDILVPSSSLKGNPDMSCGQPYGCLTPSQILPLWYFDSSSARLASCSYSLNEIPVWKCIADGNLRRVDLFIAAIIKKSSVDEVIFGVNGVLKMMVPGGRRKMYLSDTKRDRVVKIPKIIYRIINFEAVNIKHMAVIVIHNDPSGVRDTDKLCDKNDTLIRTWDTIINNDPKTGLTYICPMTTDLEKKLETNFYRINKLNLDDIPHDVDSANLFWDDEEEIVNLSFERFLKEYPK